MISSSQFRANTYQQSQINENKNPQSRKGKITYQPLLKIEDLITYFNDKEKTLACVSLTLMTRRRHWLVFHLL